MATYRYYFLDDQDHIIEAEAQEFPDDARAKEMAAEIAARHPGYAMEIWQGARIVHRQSLVASVLGTPASPETRL